MLVGLGVLAGSYALLSYLAEAAARAARWWKGRKSPVYRLWQTLQQERKEGRRGAGKAVPGAALAAAAGGIALGLTARDFILSPYLAALGCAFAYYLAHRERTAEQEKLLPEVQLLVERFRSIYAATGSVMASLERTAQRLPEGEMRATVDEVLRRYRSGEGLEEVLEPLRRMGDPFLRRFALILETASESREEITREELASLEAQIRQRKRLRGKARSQMALLNGTVKFLLAANVAAASMAVLLPPWLAFFTSSLMRRGTFIVATAFAAAAYVYFDFEVRNLEGMVK